MTEFVVVLGMHRSGTSMVTNILTEAGFFAGTDEELLPPSATNEKGYFERKDVVRMNDLILQIAGGDWINPPEKEKIEAIQIDHAIKEIIEPLLDHDKVILKDPRFCLTLPVWRQALGDNLKVIQVFRDPDAIMQSLQRRDELTEDQIEVIFNAYNQRAGEYAKNLPQTSIKYEDLLFGKRDIALGELAKFLEIGADLIKIAQTVINPKLDHSRKPEENLPSWSEDIVLLVQEADRAVGEGNIAKAIEVIEKTLEISPEDGWLITTAGNLFYQVGEFEAAKEKFEEAVRLNPDFAPAYKQLAHLLIELEEIEAAEAALEKAIDLDPFDSSMQELKIGFGKEDIEPEPIPLVEAPRGSLPYILHHHTPQGHPAADIFLDESIIEEEDFDICSRVITAFNNAFDYEQENVEPEKRPNDGVWEAIKHAFHGELYKGLFDKNVDEVTKLITNGFRYPFSMGLGPGQAIFKAAKDPQTSSSISTLILDRMFGMGEALGVETYENPEQGKWGENVYKDISSLMKRLEKKLRINLTFPAIMGNFGVLAGDQIINVRTPDNLYTSYRIREILGFRKDIAVCEIGAGFGGNAWYFHQYGVNHYSLIDIPIINVLQGYFLIKTCGADQVRLFGEEDTGQPIVVRPYWEFDQLPDDSFDLIWNQDSLPEIQYDRAMEYIREIPRLTKKYFLSINQECENVGGREDLNQLVVMNLTAEVPGYERIARHPYWLRKGYVEELYQIQGKDDLPNGKALATIAETNILADLEPLYHDFSFFGVPTSQSYTVYELNQKAKAPVIIAHTAEAIARIKNETDEPISFTELFCADGYFAMAASRLGCTDCFGIDNDRDNHFEEAKVIAERLGIENISFIKADITPESSFTPTDIVANVGGLYHVDEPEKILQLSYDMAKKYLIVQSVVSLAEEDEDYFEAPAPGWDWGNRYSVKSFDKMLRKICPNVLDYAFNLLEGNDKLEDRGSVYYLIKK